MSWYVFFGTAALALLALAAEVAARIMGWHRPLLYERTAYGYRVKPSQEIRLFGNVVSYNEQGMRSGPILPAPVPDTTRILCIGDSITNGGTRVRQSNTYPSLLQKSLREAGHSVEVLNASAGGWALENEAGWIADQGVFNSGMLVLQVATHDLFQRMSGSHLVDSNPSFPSTSPSLALIGFWRRVVMPRLGLGKDGRDPGFEAGAYSVDDVRRGLAAIERMRAFAAESGAIFVMVHVPQPDGLEPQDELTSIAKAMLEEWATCTETPLIYTSDAIRAAGGRALFVDVVHPNERGNAVIASKVASSLAPMLQARARLPAVAS